MKLCKAHLESIPGSPYSQSAPYQVPKLDRESADDYDQRTWRHHCTTNASGQVAIPAMAFKQALDTTAYKLGEKIPGRRGATYKNFFTSGVLCNEDVPISNGKTIWTPENAEMVTIYANSDGKRGSGSRVMRRFPVFPSWHGVAELSVIDDIITAEVFEDHLKRAGLIVGVGRYRPEKGGTNGRFRVTKVEWKNLQL